MSVSINFYEAKSQYLISYFSNIHIAFQKTFIGQNLNTQTFPCICYICLVLSIIFVFKPFLNL